MIDHHYYIAFETVAIVFPLPSTVRCVQGGIAVTASSYIPSEKFMPPPTLRITTNALHTWEQLEEAVRVLADAIAAELETDMAGVAVLPSQEEDSGL